MDHMKIILVLFSVHVSFCTQLSGVIYCSHDHEIHHTVLGKTFLVSAVSAAVHACVSEFALPFWIISVLKEHVYRKFRQFFSVLSSKHQCVKSLGQKRNKACATGPFPMWKNRTYLEQRIVEKESFCMEQAIQLSCLKFVAPFIPSFILYVKIIPFQFVHFNLHTAQRPFEGLLLDATTDSTLHSDNIYL